MELNLNDPRYYFNVENNSLFTIPLHLPNQHALSILIRETFIRQMYKTSKQLLKIIKYFTIGRCYCSGCSIIKYVDKYLNDIYDPQYFKIIFNNYENNNIPINVFFESTTYINHNDAEICLQAFLSIDHLKLYEKTKKYRFRTIHKIIQSLIYTTRCFKMYIFTRNIHLAKMPIEYYIYFANNKRLQCMSKKLLFDLIYAKT